MIFHDLNNVAVNALHGSIEKHSYEVSGQLAFDKEINFHLILT